MRITIPTKQVRDIAKICGYRKREVTIVATDKVTLTNLNWSGGTRSEYRGIDLASGATTKPALSMNPPWANLHEGQTIDLPAGFIIARTGYFCGRESMMTIYVHPSNMPALLPA